MKLVQRAFRREFTLQEGGIKLYTLQYPRLFSFKAETRMPHGEIKIAPEGFFKRRHIATLNGTNRAEIVLGLGGSVDLHFYEHTGGPPQQFQVATKGLLHLRYELRNELDEVQIIVRRKVDWSSFTTEFEIENIGNFPAAQLAELVIYLGYIMVAVRARRSG